MIRLDTVKACWGYLLYVLEHKKNVFKVCWKRGMYLHAFTHDLSKFLPSEFFPYAERFYGPPVPADECSKQTKKYLDRRGNNQREG